MRSKLAAVCCGFAVVWAPDIAKAAGPSSQAAGPASPREISPPSAPAPAESRSHPIFPPCAEPDADGEFLSSTGCSGVFGIRGSAVSVRGAPAQEGSGLMFSAEGEEFVRRGIFSTHGLHRIAIGGGGAGFEGALLAGMTAGFRIPAGERHGPIFRAGALGYLRGNDAFYSSLLELPAVEVGYQYLRGITALELGVTSGAVLTGRQRMGEAQTRILGAGLEVGAYAALHVPWLRLGLKATRLPSNDELSTPVRALEGTLCVLSSPIAICADARETVTQAFTAPGIEASDVRSLYAGLAFGLTRER